MSSLYKDAIADARKLREAAEQNAKNRIIDAVTPKLRQLIERQINEGEGDDLLMDDGSDELVDTDEFVDLLSDEEPNSIPPAEPMDLDMGSLAMDDDGFGSLEISDDLGLDVDSGYEDMDLDEEDSEDDEKRVNINITVEGKTNYLLRHRAIRLVKALSETKNRVKRNKIRKQLNELRKALIITENSQNKRLANNLLVILKESTMRRRRRSWLFEGDEEDLDMDLDLDDAGSDEEDMDLGEDAEDSGGGATVEVDAEGLEDVLGLPSGTISDALSDDSGADEEEEEEDLDMDLGEEEEGEADETYEYGGVSETDDHDNGDDCDEGDAADDEGEIVEISETMLKRALRNSVRRQRSRKIAESRKNSRTRRIASRSRRRIREGEAKAMASSFGGGKAEKEMFVDVDENTLLNALAEELGGHQNSSNAKGKASAKASDFGGGSIKKGAVMEKRRRRIAARKLQEAKRQAIKATKIAKAAKKELNESNLFNAKLLYVTKLMQQHNLNKKQQRAIVEAMDNAKTQREAKLLFTSLNESLNKRTGKNANSNLNESVSRTGTSSKSLRSGQAPNSTGVELDRWAVLAGINS